MPVAIVKIPTFIGASRKYIQGAIKKTNVNKNPYLTKTEIAKLPTDVRDNVTNFRLAQANGRVDVKKLEKAYVGYVATKAWAADKNGDSRISLTERKNLPVDLRDNFTNFRNAQRFGPAGSIF